MQHHGMRKKKQNQSQDVENGISFLAPVFLKSPQETLRDRLLWKMWKRYLVPLPSSPGTTGKAELLFRVSPKESGSGDGTRGPKAGGGCPVYFVFLVPGKPPKKS
jgi:hypothetical protein